MSSHFMTEVAALLWSFPSFVDNFKYFGCGKANRGSHIGCVGGSTLSNQIPKTLNNTLKF